MSIKRHQLWVSDDGLSSVAIDCIIVILFTKSTRGIAQKSLHVEYFSVSLAFDINTNPSHSSHKWDCWEFNSKYSATFHKHLHGLYTCIYFARYHRRTERFNVIQNFNLNLMLLAHLVVISVLKQNTSFHSFFSAMIRFLVLFGGLN